MVNNAFEKLLNSIQNTFAASTTWTSGEIYCRMHVETEKSFNFP
uniref:Uncharacterized protein n=1 Tax=Rhizophora mucronata TaxID=61149 RepID=A0A2P2PB80_RHIMU